MQRTIYKILARYPERLQFNREQRRFLARNNITNGIGAAGGINFGTLIRRNISEFKKFDPAKVEKFLQDTERLSEIHDVEYYEGNTRLRKLIADYRFAAGVRDLCMKWASLNERRIIFFAILFALVRYGKAAYNYGVKKNVQDLFHNETRIWMQK